MELGIELAERGYVPNPLIRLGIRRLLGRRLKDEKRRATRGFKEDWVAHMRSAPIAYVPDLANAQHYEVPADFYKVALGPQLKYSSAYFEPKNRDLGAAEEAMLQRTAERAELGQAKRILELGCGWGSLTLWMAQKFPDAEIVAASNSASQRAYIEAEAAKRGLSNIEIQTEDMNAFEAEGTFDRVVSVEMFEHIRNWEKMLSKVDRWLNPGGKAFIHVFAHKNYAYPFEDKEDDDWMGKNFFSGGMMPSVDLFSKLQQPMQVGQQWVESGLHYAKTAEAWLANLDARRDEAYQIFHDAGEREPARAIQRWRIFFLSCAELFGFRGGDEWVVLHTLLNKGA